MRIPSMVASSNPSRRRFLQGTAAASTLAFAQQAHARTDGPAEELPTAFSALKPLGSRVLPIPADDFRDRLTQAQRLMSGVQPPAPHWPRAKSYDALFLSAGASLYYFTGIRWSLSERLLGLVVPRDGRPIL